MERALRHPVPGRTHDPLRHQLLFVAFWGCVLTAAAAALRESWSTTAAAALGAAMLRGALRREEGRARVVRASLLDCAVLGSETDPLTGELRLDVITGSERFATTSDAHVSGPSAASLQLGPFDPETLERAALFLTREGRGAVLDLEIDLLVPSEPDTQPRCLRVVLLAPGGAELLLDAEP